MAMNVERIARVVAAAEQLVEIETEFARAKDAEERRKASKHQVPAKQELQRAFIEYLTHHIWPSGREPGLEGFPYHRGLQIS